MTKFESQSTNFSHNFGPLPLVCPDIQLLCGLSRKVVWCHSLMLATHSQLLAKVLMDANEKIVDDSIVIVLPDFTLEQVSGLLEVMYGKSDSFCCDTKLLIALDVKFDSTKKNLQKGEVENSADGDDPIGSQLKSRTVAVASATVSVDSPVKPKMSFECPECGQLFEALENLYKHLELCEKNESNSSNTSSQTFFKCSPCSKVFSSIGEINEHVQECHVTIEKEIQKDNLFGEIDVEEIDDDEGLLEVEETIVTVAGDNNITVETVSGDRSFDQDFQLFIQDSKDQNVVVGTIEEPLNDNHGPVNSDDYDIRYMCNKCNKVFLTVDLLEKHQDSHHKVPDCPTTIMYQCNFCKDVFGTVDAHNKHTVQEHSQFITEQVDKQKLLNFFKCSRCAESFPLVKDLTEHIMKMHSEGDNSINRIRKKPNQELKSRCTYCLKTLNVRTELELHYKENHPGQDYGIYMCNHCNKIFRSIEYLEKHERVHQEIRPFQCGGCQAKFTLASTLHNHAKNCQSIPMNAMNRILLPTKVLEKEKNVYKCTFCKEEFPTNYAVKQHMKQICSAKRQKTVRPIYPKLPSEFMKKIPISRNLSNSDVVFQISENESPSFDQAVLEGADAIFNSSHPQVFDTSQDDSSYQTSQTSEFDETVTVLAHSDVLQTDSFEENIVVLNHDNGGGIISEVMINSEMENDEEDDVKSREKDRKFVCNYCQNRYYAKDHLLSHIRTHTGEKPFEVIFVFMFKTWSQFNLTG